MLACVRQEGFTVQLMAISSCKNQDFKLVPPEASDVVGVVLQAIEPYKLGRGMCESGRVWV